MPIEMIDPAAGENVEQQQIAEQLLAEAKEQGVSDAAAECGERL